MTESTATRLQIDRPAPGVARITIDGPARRNAFGMALMDEFAVTLNRLDVDGDVRVIIVTGTPPAFSAGLDVTEAPGIAASTPAEFLEIQRRGAGSMTRPRHLSKPVIAAIDGPAAGAGFALVLACDIRIATSRASFSAAFVRIGLTGADCGTTWLLPRTVGIANASELLLTGRAVDADEALRMGLINRVVDVDDLESVSVEMAGLITRNGEIGVQLTKRALQTSLEIPSLDAAVAYENRGQAIAAQSPDFARAAEAFLGRRTETPATSN